MQLLISQSVGLTFQENVTSKEYICSKKKKVEYYLIIRNGQMGMSLFLGS